MKKHISKTVAVIIVLSMLFTPVLPVTALAMEDPLILSEGEISEPTKEAEGEMLGDILGDDVQTGLTEDGLGYAYNNTLAVITEYSGTAVDVIIPKTIDGKTVTAIGYSAFENKNIKSVVIEAEITDIPDKCFWSCHYLETVTFPTTLKSIGNSAFHGCYALSCPITLDGVEVEGQAFAFAHALTTVSIKNADSIGFYAFAGCDALTSLTIENVKTIENQSFMDCTSLNSVSLKDVETIGSEAFSGCTTLGKVVLPDGLKNISSSAFADCTLLSGVYIPESVAGISNTAFANDSFLTIYGKAGSYAQTYATSNSILFVIGEIPDVSTGSAVTDDGLHYAYSGNSAVITGYSGSSVNITIPKTVDGKTVTAIAYAAFDSARIKSVVIEAEITDIPDKCFWMCHNLETITFPTTLKSIGNSAFNGCYALSCPITLDGVEVEGQAFAFANALTTVSIKNADSIGFYAFAGCDALTSLTIENVSTINHQAFMDCTSLNSVSLKDVETIGSEAFSGCTTLGKVVLPDGLKSISSSAFADCTLLSGVYIPESVAGISNTAFANDSFLTIYGKAGSYAQTYATSNSILFVIGEIPDISTGSAVTDDGLHYAYSGNSAVITGYSGSSVNTTIPKTVDGKTVTAIAYAAFDSARIKSVVIEAEITDIPDKCFWMCHNLETITFPTTLKSIGNSAFNGCYALSCPITLDGVEVEGQAFAFANALTTVSIKNADSIGFYAFAGCDALTSLTIENVKTIENQSFMDCTALTELTMKNVGQIGGEAFSGCTTLSKAVLPEGLKTISSEAFANCTLLSGVYIPASVTSINETTFAHDYFLIISAEDDGDDSEATDSYPIQFAKQHGHRYVRICFYGTGDDRGWNGHIDHEHIYDYDGRHGFYVMTDHGWAWFDQDAVGHIQDHLGGCDLELDCREVNENPNSGNKEFNEEVEHIRDRGGIVYDLTLTADGESILFSEGGQGSVDISVPFESDCEDVYVYHIDDHGNKTRVPAIYKKKTGEVYFNTPHFSSYSVEPKSTVELEINNACNALVQENPDSSGVLLIAFYLSNGQMVSCEQGTLDSMNDVELPVQWVTCKIFLLGNNYAPVASDEISAK